MCIYLTIQYEWEKMRMKSIWKNNNNKSYVFTNFSNNFAVLVKDTQPAVSIVNLGLLYLYSRE